MAEEQIVTNIVAKSDFSNLIADLNKVSSALLNLQAKLNATNKNLSSQVNVMNRSFAETMRSTGQYSTHFVSLASDVDKFGSQLDKGQIKLKQFFQTYQSHIKTNGGLIRQLAQQQVQLQNAILQPIGKNAEGLMQYNVHIPAGLDKVKNKTALAKQELQIMNKVIQEGANQLINWGKNTQWAGRQLTVGLTLPLAAFGKASADAFRQADQELTRLTKVYGGVAATSSQELKKVREDVSKTATELSKAYGSSFKDTIALAADIAATGKQGDELLGSIKETTRLAVLGEVDRQDAMKATLAIQTAFKQNTEQLSESINFLNAVENQTSTTLNDLVEAIPKAGPIIQGLGGSVKDLALYLTAMREGGISASEGANALKSGLASLINPTKVAKDMFAGFGISLTDIVEKNAGNTTATILELQSALERLNPLQKQQALEQLFGKFQFARMNALFENLGKQGSQTLQVLDLMKASSQDLANIAGRELSQVTESASGKYRRAIEGLKADLAGVGEQFLTINTYIINIVDGILKFVNKLPGPVKTILSLFGGLTALAGPMIMLTGVLANFFGYIVKGISHFKALAKGGEGWRLLTPEILAANKAGNLVEQTFFNDSKAAEILNQAIMRLSASYERLASDAAGAMIATNPQISTLKGTPIVLDKTPRVANPGHSKIGEVDTRAAAHGRPVGLMTPSEKALQTIHSVTPNPVDVNQAIGKAPQIFSYQNMPVVPGLTQIGGVSTGIVAGEAAKWHTLMATLSMQTKQEVAQLRKEIFTTGTISQEFLSTYSTILPAMTDVIDNAVIKSAQIVQQAELGQLKVDQAQAKIIAINAQLEADMAATTSMMAQQMGRTANLTMVPLTGEAVVDKTGKSNLRALFKEGRASKKMLDIIARATGVKTWGGGYSIETTVPKKFAQGGTVVGGPRSDTTDTQFAYLNEGDFVLNRKASDALLGFNQGGQVPAMVTPGEIVVHNPTPEELDKLSAYNNQFAFGGRVTGLKNNYGPLNLVARNRTRDLGLLRNSRNSSDVKNIGALSETKGMSVEEFYAKQKAQRKQARMAGSASTLTRDEILASIQNRIPKYERDFYYDGIDNKHQDRAHGLVGAVAEGIRAYRGYFGIASVNKYNKTQNKLNRLLGTRNVNPVTDKTAQEEILPDIFAKMGSGNWFSANAMSNGVLDKGMVQSYLNHLRDYKAGKTKWNSKFFGPYPVNLFSRRVNHDELHDYIEYLMSDSVTRINKTGIILNDAAALSKVRKLSPDKAILKAEEIYNKSMGQDFNDHEYYANRLDITEKQFPEFLNSGGIVGGRVRGGQYNYGIPSPKFKSQLNKRLGITWGQGLAGDGLTNNPPTSGFGNLALQIGMGKKLFGGYGLSPNTQNLLYDALAAELETTTPSNYIKMQNIIGGTKLVRAMDPNQTEGMLFGAASKIARHSKISKRDKEILAGWAHPLNSTLPKGLLAKITGKMFGYNRGGVVGGRVRRGKHNYGIKVNNTSKMLFDPNDPYKNSYAVGSMERQPKDYQGSMMAGFGLQAAGSMVGGGAGNAMMFGGLLMQFAPMLSKMTSATKGITTMRGALDKMGSGGTKAIQMLGNAFKFLKGPIGGPLVIVTALTAAFLILKKRATEFGEANRLAFGGTTKSFASVGITRYKTLEDRIKAVNEQMELNKAKAQTIYNQYTKAGPTGITLSIEELNKAIENAKKNQKEYVAGFDKIDNGQVVQYAANLKAQFVAMGLSATEASNQIYGIIKASNKAGMALEAVSSADFRGITNQVSALTKLFDNLGAASTKNKFNAEEFATGLDTLINAVINYQQSLIGTKDALNSKNIIDEAEALQKTMEAINKIKTANVALDTEQVKKLKEQNIVYNAILSNQETLESITAKILLYNSQMGQYVNLSMMSAADAITMAQSYGEVQKGLSDITSNIASGTTLDDNPLLSLAKSIDAADKASKNYAKSIKAAQKLDENYYKDKIAAIDKVIKKIQDESDARIKAIQEQQNAENTALEIQKKQLEYQNALAAGDMEAAAAAQLDIQQLVKEKQYNDAITAIKDREKKLVDAEVAKKEKLAAEEDARNRSVNTAINKNEQTTANLSELKTFMDTLNNEAIAYRAAKDQGDSGKKSIALNNAMVTLEQMRTGSASAQKEYQKLLADYKIKASDGPAALAGALMAKMNTKMTDIPGGSKFADAVALFDAAVKKFAGTTGQGSGTLTDPLKVQGSYVIDSRAGVANENFYSKDLVAKNNLKAGAVVSYQGVVYRLKEKNYFEKAPEAYQSKKAVGGRVVPGREYRVGERGEEIFRPDVSGTIYPNPKTAPKQNWFQKYVSSLTESSDSLPSWARDPLGSEALLRKLAGQGRSGDTLNAALAPLNFVGMGVTKNIGKSAISSTEEGIKALAILKEAVHSSKNANLHQTLMDAEKYSGSSSNRFGSHAMYFARPNYLNQSSFGLNKYSPNLSEDAINYVSQSKGFITDEILAKQYGLGLSNKNGLGGLVGEEWTPELISRLKNDGYIGYLPAEKTGQLTSWMFGKPGFGIKPIIPKFENGINSVPVDMLAQLHANEAVIPANMNPFNPNANNATMGNTYNFAPTINAAPGMDENALTNLVIKKFEASVGLKNTTQGRNRTI
jgi:TP901 family phage tail tape measure protein